MLGGRCSETLKTKENIIASHMYVNSSRKYEIKFINGCADLSRLYALFNTILCELITQVEVTPQCERNQVKHTADNFRAPISRTNTYLARLPVLLLQIFVHACVGTHRYEK